MVTILINYIIWLGQVTQQNVIFDSECVLSIKYVHYLSLKHYLRNDSISKIKKFISARKILINTLNMFQFLIQSQITKLTWRFFSIKIYLLFIQ